VDDLCATKSEDVGLIVGAVSFQDFQHMRYNALLSNNYYTMFISLTAFFQDNLRKLAPER